MYGLGAGEQGRGAWDVGWIVPVTYAEGGRTTIKRGMVSLKLSLFLMFWKHSSLGRGQAG